MADVHIDKLLTSPDFMALIELAAQAVSVIIAALSALTHNMSALSTHPYASTCTHACTRVTSGILLHSKRILFHL